MLPHAPRASDFASRRRPPVPQPARSARLASPGSAALQSAGCVRASSPPRAPGTAPPSPSHSLPAWRERAAATEPRQRSPGIARSAAAGSPSNRGPAGPAFHCPAQPHRTGRAGSSVAPDRLAPPGRSALRAELSSDCGPSAGRAPNPGHPTEVVSARSGSAGCHWQLVCHCSLPGATGSLSTSALCPQSARKWPPFSAPEKRLPTFLFARRASGPLRPVRPPGRLGKTRMEQHTPLEYAPSTFGPSGRRCSPRRA